MTYEEAFKKTEDHFGDEEFSYMIANSAVIARNVKDDEPFWSEREGVEMAVCSFNDH